MKRIIILLMAGMFLVLYRSLPGQSGLVKGLSYALIVWFFRVIMGVFSTWMMLDLPLAVHVYTLVTGLGEMMVLGVLFGYTLAPNKQEQ